MRSISYRVECGRVCAASVWKLGYHITIRYSMNYSIQLYDLFTIYIKQNWLNKYSCSETVAKLMKLLLKDWLLLIANKTSVPVKFERVLRIFDSPCETTLFTSSV
jgi:hypothetical protein